MVAAANLIADGDSILLVKESKASARGRYNLPSGRLERGETLIGAAEREAREETGLDVAVTSLLGIYHCPATTEGFPVINFVFESRVVDGEPASSEQHPQVRYVPYDEVHELAERHLLRGTHILKAIAAHRGGHRLPLDLVQIVEPSRLPGENAT